MDESGPVVGIVRLPHAEDLPLPAYLSAAAAGMDLCAACNGTVTIAAGARALIPTGLVLELPPGHEGQVRPRSGLALRHGVTCLNTPGTIDADYRGEIKVLLVNLGDEPFAVTRGMRIAQLIVAPVVRARIEERSEPTPSMRGDGGFGSTGL